MSQCWIQPQWCYEPSELHNDTWQKGGICFKRIHCRCSCLELLSILYWNQGTINISLIHTIFYWVLWSEYEAKTLKAGLNFNFFIFHHFFHCLVVNKSCYWNNLSRWISHHASLLLFVMVVFFCAKILSPIPVSWTVTIMDKPFVG